ncbi:MAG: 2-phosphosulfolactate phosphatase [Planctomycetota bacterium]|jgi:2-phosphosulfolactate phosphatase
MSRLAIEFGPDGIDRARQRGDEACVIVDVLSFCTTVATAIGHGGAIIAGGWMEDPPAGYEVAQPRGTPGGFSLSPLTMQEIRPGQTIVLPSPNGSACSRRAAGIPHVLAGALVNATAVGRYAASLGGDITIVACGEEGRFALEDHLGAAAIAAAIEGEVLPGAAWFRDAVFGCRSGIELIELGFEADVEHAVNVDRYDLVPEYVDGAYRATLPRS